MQWYLKANSLGFLKINFLLVLSKNLKICELFLSLRMCFFHSVCIDAVCSAEGFDSRWMSGVVSDGFPSVSKPAQLSCMSARCSLCLERPRSPMYVLIPFLIALSYGSSYTWQKNEVVFLHFSRCQSTWSNKKQTVEFVRVSIHAYAGGLQHERSQDQTLAADSFYVFHENYCNCSFGRGLHTYCSA